VIRRFLKLAPGFVPDDLLPFLPEPFRERASLGEGTLFVAPHMLNADGFFIARMRRED